MRYIIASLLVTAAVPAIASPPPPPPEYVSVAGEILAAPSGQDKSKVAALFADDVSVTENGAIIAQGKSSWSRWRTLHMSGGNGRTIGYSESSAGYTRGAGELLIVDTYDMVDRSNLPPNFLADPRMATRATLYRFGPDHLIHSVNISQTGGFWMKPRG